MSVEAICWALKQPVARSSTKFVLVAMSNCANVEGLSWPSVQYLCEATAQDRKTVLANMARLAEEGYIVDTGERRGITKQVVVYQLNSPKNGTVQQSQKRDHLRVIHSVPEQSQKRDASDGETVPFFPGNSPVFPRKQSQKRDTEPSGTVIEPNTPLPPMGESDGFDAFWTAYPRQANEAAARREWAALAPDAELQAVILAALVHQAGSAEWQREGGRFVPAAHRWIKGQRWRDTLPMAGDVGTAGGDGWPDTRGEVEAIGERLGLGVWDEDGWYDSVRQGRHGEPFAAYEARVKAAWQAARHGGRAA